MPDKNFKSLCKLMKSVIKESIINTILIVFSGLPILIAMLLMFLTNGNWLAVGLSVILIIMELPWLALVHKHYNE